MVSLHHPLRIHSVDETKQFVRALDFIARCRGQPAHAVYNSRLATVSFDCALIYVAFHQFFVTQKYLVVLGLKRDAVNRTISDACTARVEAHIAIAATNNEFIILRAVATMPEPPIDFSIPAAQIPALRATAKVAHAAAVVEAQLAHADAVQAELDAAATIRLHENYCAYMTHYSNRAREEL
jgi:hypothetical protein